MTSSVQYINCSSTITGVQNELWAQQFVAACHKVSLTIAVHIYMYLCTWVVPIIGSVTDN